MSIRRRRRRYTFLKRHQTAIEVIFMVSLIAITSYFIIMDQLRSREGVVIGGISYDFGTWGPIKELRYDITIKTIDNTPELLVYYYVPTTNGTNQRVIFDQVTYVMGPANYVREVKTIGEDSVVVWYLTDVPGQREIRILHTYHIQTRSFISRIHHTIPQENNVEKWLGSTSLINADDENILALAGQLKATSRWKTAERIYKWIQNNIKYSFVTMSRQPARAVLASRKGDCDDTNGLAVSLARAVNIPSRVVIGTYGESQYIPFHAWTEIYTEGGWVPVDFVNINLPVGSLTQKYVRIYADPNSPLTPADLGYTNLTNTTTEPPLITVGYSCSTCPLVDWHVRIISK